MLQEAQRTSAPSACSVSISTAVWMVMCSEPAIRAPRSGCTGPNSRRIAMRPGISTSAMAISLRPQEASARSLTKKSGVWAFGLGEGFMEFLGSRRAAWAIGYKDFFIWFPDPAHGSIVLAEPARDEPFQRGHDIGGLPPGSLD